MTGGLQKRVKADKWEMLHEISSLEHRLEVLGDDAPGRRGPVARLGRVAHDDRLDLEAHAARRRHDAAVRALPTARIDRPAQDHKANYRRKEEKVE